jgi:hypothetical protein
VFIDILYRVCSLHKKTKRKIKCVIFFSSTIKFDDNNVYDFGCGEFKPQVIYLSDFDANKILSEYEERIKISSTPEYSLSDLFRLSLISLFRIDGDFEVFFKRAFNVINTIKDVDAKKRCLDTLSLMTLYKGSEELVVNYIRFGKMNVSVDTVLKEVFGADYEGLVVALADKDRALAEKDRHIEDIVKNLLLAGNSISYTAKIVNLDIETVEKINDEIQNNQNNKT